MWKTANLIAIPLSWALLLGLVLYGLLHSRYKSYPRLTRFLLLMACLLTGCVIGVYFSGVLPEPREIKESLWASPPEAGGRALMRSAEPVPSKSSGPVSAQQGVDR